MAEGTAGQPAADCADFADSIPKTRFSLRLGVLARGPAAPLPRGRDFNIEYPAGHVQYRGGTAEDVSNGIP